MIRFKCILRAVSLTGLIGFLFCDLASAQNPRDDWKHVSESVDLAPGVGHSLAEAPLSNSERAAIYRTVDNQTIHDSYTDAQRKEERETVLGARVVPIELASDGSQQLLVIGPAFFCGATGNCPLWIFVRNHGQLRLALEAGGGLLILRKSSSHGSRDIVTGWHMSAFDEVYNVYRWDGTKYQQTDCYQSGYDRNGASDTPTITDCPKAPQ